MKFHNNLKKIFATAALGVGLMASPAALFAQYGHHGLSPDAADGVYSPPAADTTPGNPYIYKCYSFDDWGTNPCDKDGRLDPNRPWKPVEIIADGICAVMWGVVIIGGGISLARAGVEPLFF